MKLHFTLHRLDVVGSTNDEARRLAAEGASNGTVVTARMQTAGRGRQARTWASPPGNLHMSILLHLTLPPTRLSELSFIAALAVADAADSLLPAGKRAALKWPNDVLVAGAKIAGILVERTDPGAVIVGIGVNVLHRPQDTRYPAGSLAEAGAAVPSVDETLTGVLAAFATRFDSWLTQGFGPIRATWLARAHPAGTMLSVHAGQSTVEGAFAGLDADGALLLRTSDGLRRIVAGDVVPG